MFRLLWVLSVRIRYFLRRCMPHILLDLIRSRCGLKWGIPAMLLVAPYLLAASAFTTMAVDGRIGWLDLLVLLCVWNAMKFLVMGLVSFVLLIRLRIQEAAHRRQADRLSETTEIHAT